MAIWLRAREEFADNRFQLLFIYIDIYEHEAAQKPISENNIGAPLVWLARPSHLIAGALRAGKGRSSGSNN